MLADVARWVVFATALVAVADGCMVGTVTVGLDRRSKELRACSPATARRTQRGFPE